MFRFHVNLPVYPSWTMGGAVRSKNGAVDSSKVEDKCVLCG